MYFCTGWSSTILPGIPCRSPFELSPARHTESEDPLPQQKKGSSNQPTGSQGSRKSIEQRQRRKNRAAPQPPPPRSVGIAIITIPLPLITYPSLLPTKRKKKERKKSSALSRAWDIEYATPPRDNQKKEKERRQQREKKMQRSFKKKREKKIAITITIKSSEEQYTEETMEMKGK